MRLTTCLDERLKAGAFPRVRSSLWQRKIIMGAVVFHGVEHRRGCRLADGQYEGVRFKL